VWTAQCRGAPASHRRRGREFGDVCLGAVKQCSDRGKNLAEIVVKFGRDRPQRLFLHRNQLPCQFATALGKPVTLIEDAAVVLHHVSSFIH
jgi:hypothetical protein